MSELICPLCKDPVKDHGDFYCMHVYCKCNYSYATAEALAKNEIYLKALAMAYAQSGEVASAVAKVCDEYADTTGALLGKIREMAKTLKRAKSS